ncbi:GMC family oxidoreductase [Mycolicibacterium sp.]|uniref:GMC family oxidoreductase n=1 Tax=Mycolicibacterium sp. TaxID=2320850 RepID=UPI0028A58D8C|nr:GMC family oxidoreductase [Mycolicibacterium sp.]
MTEITDNHRACLRALADTVVPSMPREDDPTGFWAASGSTLGADVAVAQVISTLPEEQQHGLLSLLDGMHVFGFATGSQRSREQVIRNVALMGAAPAAGMKALTSLTAAMAYAVPDPNTGVNPAWTVFGYDGLPRIAPGGPEPLPTFTPTDSTCAADVCIVGSGAGGGLIAGVLAKAGLNVIVLEAGQARNEADFLGYEMQAYQQLFWRGGPNATADGNVSMLAASTLGGGPTVNWTNCLRTPEWVRDHWAEEFGLKDVATPDYDAHIDAVWERLGVNGDCSDLNGPHQRMRAGAEALGWSFTTLTRNADPQAYSPDSAGHIGFGDRSGGKRDMRHTYLRDLVDAGGKVIVGCAAKRVLVENGRAAGVEATYTDPATGATRELTITAPRVVVACGSLESPALLLRSGIGGPAVGKYLHLHPAMGFLGIYPEETTPWWGAPMTAMVDEFADVKDGYGFLIQNAQFSPSLIVAGIARASGAEHKETIAQLGHAAFLVAFPRDRGHGTVTIDADGNAVINYSMTDEVDLLVAQTSIEKQIRLHHAAGAEQIIPLGSLTQRWRRGDDLEAFIKAVQNTPLRAGGVQLFSAHQMSSCRLGSDPQTSVANTSGELHDTPGVYIGDASGMPTASGTNPMISAMSLAHRTATNIANEAKPAVNA